MDRRVFLTSSSAVLSFLELCPASITTVAAQTQENDKKTVWPFVPGSWTLVILPDTQKYSRHYPGLLQLQTRWILENKDKNNIVYVMQNGDITNNNTGPEWERASRLFGILDSAVPYALVPGNHDYDNKEGKGIRRETTKINDYFPPSRCQKWSTFGGTMEKGRIENNYHLFDAGGRKWIIIGLEWGPRDETLQWADRLLNEYADRKAIVFTHAYLYSDSTRYDWAKKGKSQPWNPHDPIFTKSGIVNDGEEIWQKLIKKHYNVFMVMNGHVLNDGLGFQVSKTDRDKPVNEMLVNYQMQEIGGGGRLRLLEFQPDGRTVQVRTYSPLYEQYETSPDNQFIMNIE